MKNQLRVLGFAERLKRVSVKFLVLNAPLYLSKCLITCFWMQKLHLYKLHRSICLSTHWREDCTVHDDQKEADGAIKLGPSGPSWKNIKTKSLQVNNLLPTGTYFAPTSVGALRSWMICTWRLFKLCNDLKSCCQITIGETETALLFFNTFFAEHCNKCVQQKSP